MRTNRLAFATAFLVVACDGERNPADSPGVLPPAALVAQQIEFSVTDLGTLGGGWSRPGDKGAMNDAGQVVGSSETATGEVHAFVWDHGVMTDLGLPGGNSHALAINQRGLIIGSYYEECGPGCHPLHGFLWDHGVITELGMSPTAINDVGQIVGNSPGIPGRGLLWERGVKTDLGALTVALAVNNAGQVVGSTGVPPYRALLWEDGVITELGDFGGGNSQATAINNRGQVVGNARTATGETHAFLWEAGVLTDLGTLGGTWSVVDPGDIVPGGINDRGQVVGVSGTPDGYWSAFLWEHGGMTDLGQLTGALGSVGWMSNNAGEIIGTYEVEGNDHVFVWAKGVMTALPDLDSEHGGWPAGINSVGQIAAFSGWHAVLWERRPRAGAGR